MCPGRELPGLQIQYWTEDSILHKEKNDAQQVQMRNIHPREFTGRVSKVSFLITSLT